MKAYPVKIQKLSGTDFHEVRNQALNIYKRFKNKTKRRTYIRSAYFNKSKVFIEIYWHHLYEQGNWHDRMRRLKYLPCAIELIQKSRFEPSSKENPNKSSEILHRFVGITKDHDIFYVQIKEDKHTSQKFLISIFPAK